MAKKKQFKPAASLIRIIVLPLLLDSFLSIVAAYPIQDLKNHIESGNIAYVEKYLSDLSEREFSQPDMQFLRALLDIEVESLEHLMLRIHVEDLSGHLAPVYHLKKAELALHQNQYSDAIPELKNILFHYESSAYIDPASTLLLKCYQNLDQPDSAVYYQDWIRKHLPNAFAVKQIISNSKGRKQVSEPKSEENYTIQLGAFGQRKNAENLVRKLNKAGFTARIDIIHKNSKSLYTVRVGNYEKRKDANRVKTQLRKKFKMTSYIKRLNR